MTESSLPRPAVLPAAALTPGDLILLHAEALNLCEWADGVPPFPSGPTGVADRP